MAPKVQKQVIFDITSVEQFQEIISPENKKLVVIDLFLNWCGPCQSMENNFRTIFFGHESSDQRLSFYRASEDVIPEEVLAGLKHGALSCRPRFILYCVRKNQSSNYPNICFLAFRKERRGKRSLMRTTPKSTRL